MTRDTEGHREYKLTYRVVCSSVLDGPAIALTAPGLPIPGSLWVVGNDVDLWAYCKQNVTITPVLDNEPNDRFDLEFTFGTKTDEKRCKDQQYDDPLLEPAQVSGTFIKYQEEATHDRHGGAITNSAHEQLRGPQIEFDKNRAQIKIQQNVATPTQGYILPYQMLDTLNDAPLWGFPRRCIKLSAAPWERKFHGQCYAYYQRTLEFDTHVVIDPTTGEVTSGFDRELLDEGSKVLNGHWSTSGVWVLDNISGAAPDPNNPSHFQRFKDRKGENSRVILNGYGVPAETLVSLGDLYISIAGSNLGNDLSNTAKWIPLAGGTTPTTWDELVNYVRGNLVIAPDSNTYVCLAAHLDDQPPSAGIWQSVTGITLAGDYSAATTYASGEVVTDTTQTGAGSIHVEKYNESNFVLLGVPTVF